MLHLSAAHTGVVLKLAPRRVERVANDDVHVLVVLLRGWLARDGDLLVRHLDVDLDREEIALVAVLVRRIDDHAATDDVVVKLLELLCAGTDRGLDGGRAADVVPSDL